MSTTVSSDELLVSRLPIAIWLSLVFAASLILQNFTRPAVAGSLIFALAMAPHFYIHWNAHRLAKMYPWGYVLVQHVLIGIGALLLPEGYQAILIGFLPVLVAQSLAVFDRKRKIAGVLLANMSLFAAIVGMLGQIRDLALLAPLFMMMLVVVIAYALLFFNQVHARIRTQAFLNDLENAHRKVEELTLANERQRMARDLHDTLAQGVAGLIMQLEAAEAFIMQGNSGRTETIIRQSKAQARKTLADARRAIDNLRSKSGANTDFREAAEAEIERFVQAIGMVVHADIRFGRSPSRMAAEHLLQILSECLTNVAKHAQADKVWVSISEHGGRLELEIRDNGIGFNVNQVGKQVGHYGLLGIQERVRLFGGEFHLTSTDEGTRVRVQAPSGEGETL